MGAYMYWTDELGDSKILYFDVCTDEQHHLQSEATEHPVEKGADVTDHVRPKVARLSLSYFVSNTPIICKQDLANKISQPGTLYGVQDGSVEGVEIKPPVYEPTLLAGATQVLNPNNALNTIVRAIFGARQYKAQVLQFSEPFDNVKEVYQTLERARQASQLVSVVTSVRTYSNMSFEDITQGKTSDTGTGATFKVELKEIRLVSAKKVNLPVPKEDNGKVLVNKGSKGPKEVKASVWFKGTEALGKWVDVDIFKGLSGASQ